MKAAFLAIVMLSLGVGGCTSDRLAKPADTKVAEHDCVRETGSRIKKKDGECLPGKVYTAEELDATGAATVGEALRKLPPR